MPATTEHDLLRSYTTDLADCTPLSLREECNLAAKIKQGDLDARNRLVVANLRFVMSVARGYQNLGLPLSDLISAGNLGLIRAAERFDGQKGFRFITYAVWWIRQAIQYALIQHARTVRLPASRVELLRKIVQFVDKYPFQNPEREIAEAFDIPEAQVVDLLNIGSLFRLSRERIHQIKTHALRKLRHHPKMRTLIKDAHNN